MGTCFRVLDRESAQAIGGSGLRTDVRREKETVPIKAVHDDDLVQYLGSLGVVDHGGNLGRCKLCSSQVTLNNLAALFPESGSVKLVCDAAGCLLALQELLREGKVRL
jgi:hypothetical protein